MRCNKKCFGLFFIFAVLIMKIPVQAADEMVPKLIYPQEADRTSMLYTEQSVENSTQTIAEKRQILLEFEDRVEEALLTGKNEADMTGLDMDYNLFIQMSQMIPYFVNGIRPMSFTEGASVFFVNPLSQEETSGLINTVHEVISDVDNLTEETMTDLEKALVVHDYLVYKSEYDYDNYLNGTIPYDSYYCGGILVNGRGVCNGYARAFEYFMYREGIECYMISSTEMNHAWNIVSIDGRYYHVDCTWDDPVQDRLGKVQHKYFLVSDSAMKSERNHYGWTTSLVCDDTSYDNAFWTEVESQIIKEDKKLYYLKGRSIICRTGELETPIVDLGTWPVWQGSGWWTNANSGLFYRDGYLYFNTYSRIERISTDTLEKEIVFEPDLSEGYIYGIRDQREEIEYVIKQSYSDDGTIYTTPLPADESGSTPGYIAGDLTGEGNIDVFDLRLMLRYVCDKTELTEQQLLAADVEKDSAGTVNINDLRKMLRFICRKIETLE